MPNLDDWNRFVKSAGNTPPEQKLSIIRSETITPISSIKGFAHIMKLKIDPSTPNLPEGFFYWLDEIIKNVEYVERVMEFTRTDTTEKK